VAVSWILAPIWVVAGFGVIAMEESCMPVPERLIVCVEPVTFPLLSVMVICALLCVPDDVGAKSISRIQLAPIPSPGDEMGHGEVASTV